MTHSSSCRAVAVKSVWEGQWEVFGSVGGLLTVDLIDPIRQRCGPCIGLRLNEIFWLRIRAIGYSL